MKALTSNRHTPVVLASFLCVAAGATAAAAASTESTLLVTRDPGAFATLNREFTWELAWRPTQSLAPGTRFQLRCRNLRTFASWTYRGVELDSSAEATFESFAKPRSGDTITTVKERGLALGQGSFPKGLQAGQVVKMRLHAEVYVNLAGRDPGGVVPAGDYEVVRDQIIAAFEGLTDPSNPGKQIVSAIFRKEELRDVDGSDSLHPNRSGDVVVVLRPRDQFDAATPGRAIAFSQFFGQHGYLPGLVDLDDSVNLRGTFVAAGPGFLRRDPLPGVRAFDLAPTISMLMGIPGPRNAPGRILYEILPDPGQRKEITILNISKSR